METTILTITIIILLIINVIVNKTNMTEVIKLSIQNKKEKQMAMELIKLIKKAEKQRAIKQMKGLCHLVKTMHRIGEVTQDECATLMTSIKILGFRLEKERLKASITESYNPYWFEPRDWKSRIDYLYSITK